MSGNFRSMQGARRERVLAVALGILLLAGTLLAGAVPAATLGKLTVTSALGQPFRGEIEVAATRAELDALGARLASRDAYRAAGLSYSPAFQSLTFTLDARRGAHYLAVASPRPIAEPVIDLLVEIATRTGRASYAYTALPDVAGPSRSTFTPSVVAVDHAGEPPQRAVTRHARTANAGGRRLAAQIKAREEDAIMGQQKLDEVRARIAQLQATADRQAALLAKTAPSARPAAAVRVPAASAPANSAAHGKKARGAAAPAPATAAQSPFFDTSDPMLYAAIAIAVVGLLGAVQTARRRRRNRGLDSDDTGARPAWAAAA